MATTAQVLANRANAQLSTGPKTTQGRFAASQNATTPRSIPGNLLAPRPASGTEEFLVTEMARTMETAARGLHRSRHLIRHRGGRRTLGRHRTRIQVRHGRRASQPGPLCVFRQPRRTKLAQASVNCVLNAPIPGAHLERELQAHRHRDPLFDPGLEHGTPQVVRGKPAKPRRVTRTAAAYPNRTGDCRAL